MERLDKDETAANCSSPSAESQPTIDNQVSKAFPFSSPIIPGILDIGLFDDLEEEITAGSDSANVVNVTTCLPTAATHITVTAKDSKPPLLDTTSLSLPPMLIESPNKSSPWSSSSSQDNMMEYLHHQQNQEQHQLQQQEVDDETAALNTADWALNFFDSSPRSGGDFSGSVSADGTMIPSVSLPMCFEDQLTDGFFDVDDDDLKDKNDSYFGDDDFFKSPPYQQPTLLSQQQQQQQFMRSKAHLVNQNKRKLDSEINDRSSSCSNKKQMTAKPSLQQPQQYHSQQQTPLSIMNNLDNYTAGNNTVNNSSGNANSGANKHTNNNNNNLPTENLSTQGLTKGQIRFREFMKRETEEKRLQRRMRDAARHRLAYAKKKMEKMMSQQMNELAQ